MGSDRPVKSRPCRRRVHQARLPVADEFGEPSSTNRRVSGPAHDQAARGQPGLHVVSDSCSSDQLLCGGSLWSRTYARERSSSPSTRFSHRSGASTAVVSRASTRPPRPRRPFSGARSKPIARGRRPRTDGPGGACAFDHRLNQDPRVVDAPAFEVSGVGAPCSRSLATQYRVAAEASTRHASRRTSGPVRQIYT